MARYRRAPITEAVIELRLAAPTSADNVEKVKGLLTADYALTPQQLNAVTMRSDAKPTVEFAGYRMMTADAANIANVQRQAVSVSRLAPYTNWEDFIGRARATWGVWRKVVGWQEVARIGVRYINRIDVPNPEDKPIPIERYLRFRPYFPAFEGAEGMDSFGINAVAPIGSSGFRLILNAGSADSPLVKTTSFLLDLDISREISLPKSDEALWAMIDEVRPLKNRVFEACITDEARGLFS